MKRDWHHALCVAPLLLQGGCFLLTVPRGYYHVAVKNGSRTEMIRDVRIGMAFAPLREELGPLRVSTVFPATEPVPEEIPVEWVTADGVRHAVTVRAGSGFKPQTNGFLAFVIQADGGVVLMCLSGDKGLETLLADRAAATRP